jgi:hypothetical protein
MAPVVVAVVVMKVSVVLFAQINSRKGLTRATLEVA